MTFGREVVILQDRAILRNITIDGVRYPDVESGEIREGDRVYVRLKDGKPSIIVEIIVERPLPRRWWEPRWLPMHGTAGRTRWQEARYQWQIVGFWRWWWNRLTERDV